MKTLYRNKHITIRNSMDETQKQNADKKILETLKKHHIITECKHIMVYISVNGEVDTLGLINYLLGTGKNIYVPVISKNDIIPDRLVSLNNLETGKYGIPKPEGEPASDVNTSIIEAVIVPGLCFTKDGTRLGRGGGYYDRFLSKLSDEVLTIGLCYERNIENCLPVTDRDISVKEVITERTSV